MTSAFWICLAIWLGGAALGQLTGNRAIHAISVNVFGLITIGLGVVMMVRWAWRRLFGSASGSSLRQGMPIMSMVGVDSKLADVCERAIQAEAFKPVGKRPDGSELLHIQSPYQDYLAHVEVVNGAIYLNAVYPTSRDRLAQDVESYLRS